jgi:exosortase
MARPDDQADEKSKTSGEQRAASALRKVEPLDPAQARRASIWLGMLSAGVLFLYGPTLQRLSQIWWRDPQYSHGFLVLPFAIWLLWFRQERLDWTEVKGSWSGLFVLAAGLGLRYAGVALYYEWFEHASLLVALTGLALLAGGWKLFRWSALAIGFLIFMIPFPFRIEIMLSDPLQRLATEASCYMLQTMGVLAVSVGNMILLEDAPPIDVVQACNGLRMAVSFLALCSGAAILVQRPVWERVLVVFSAVPIALVCNILRITFTGYASTWVSADTAQTFHKVSHDFSGYMMMPLALCFVALELWLVKFLLVDPDASRPVLVVLPEQALRGTSGGAKR